MYFEENADAEYVECHVGINVYYAQVGRKQEIHLWNEMYQRVK